MTLLFQDGDFTSHAGLPLAWKIECDAITDDEWRCLAKMVMDHQTRPFYKAVGIPRGGLKFAEAMNEYASGNDTDQIMICDDVFTTGTSMLDFIKEEYPNENQAIEGKDPTASQAEVTDLKIENVKCKYNDVSVVKEFVSKGNLGLQSSLIRYTLLQKYLFIEKCTDRFFCFLQRKVYF